MTVAREYPQDHEECQSTNKEERRNNQFPQARPFSYFPRPAASEFFVIGCAITVISGTLYSFASWCHPLCWRLKIRSELNRIEIRLAKIHIDIKNISQQFSHQFSLKFAEPTIFVFIVSTDIEFVRLFLHDGIHD